MVLSSFLHAPVALYDRAVSYRSTYSKCWRGLAWLSQCCLGCVVWASAVVRRSGLGLPRTWLAIAAGALLAGIGQQVYLSSTVVPTRLTGIRFAALPDGARRMYVTARVTPNAHCVLNGVHSMFYDDPVDGLQNNPLGSVLGGGVEFSAHGDRITWWVRVESDIDLSKWRYSYRTWYTCNPVGLIHWANSAEIRRMAPYVERDSLP